MGIFDSLKKKNQPTENREGSKSAVLLKLPFSAQKPADHDEPGRSKNQDPPSGPSQSYIQIQSLQRRNESLTAQNTQLQDRLRFLESQHRSRADAALQEATESLAFELQTVQGDLQRVQNVLEERTQELRQAHETNHNLNSKLRDLREDKELRTAIHNSELQHLEFALEQAIKTAEGKADERVREMESELQRKAREMDSEQNTRTKEMQAWLSREIKRIENDAEFQLARIKDEKKAVQREKQSLQALEQTVTQERDRLRTELATIRRQQDRLQAELVARDNEKEMIKEEKQALEEQKQTVTLERNSLRTDLAARGRQLESLRKDLRKKDAQLEYVQQLLAAFMDQDGDGKKALAQAIKISALPA